MAAEGEYILLEALPVPGASAITETSNIGQYLNGVFRLGIGLASVLAVLMITIGGLQYMTSDKIQLKTDSKTTISNALWGLVLVLASFLLLKTINTDLVNFSLDLPPVIMPTMSPASAPKPYTKETWVGECKMYEKDRTYYVTMPAYGSTYAECAGWCQDSCEATKACHSATDTCKKNEEK